MPRPQKRKSSGPRCAQREPAPALTHNKLLQTRIKRRRSFFGKVVLSFTAGFAAAVVISGVVHLGRISSERNAVRIDALHTRFDPVRAMAHADAIADVVPRSAGSDGARRVRDYLRRTLLAEGWRVEIQAFKLPGRSRQQFANLIAHTGSRLGRKPCLVLAASFDAPAHPYLDLPAAAGSATAPALLLEIARILARSPADARHVELALLDARHPAVQPGPEDGLAGARAYCETLRRAPRGRFVDAVLVLETLGSSASPLAALPHSNESLVLALAQAAERTGKPIPFEAHPRRIWSGELPFILAGFRAAALTEASNPVVFTMDDLPDRIDAKRVESVGRIVITWIQSALTRSPAASFQ